MAWSEWKKFGGSGIKIPHWSFNPRKLDANGGSIVTFNVADYSTINIELLHNEYIRTYSRFDIYEGTGTSGTKIYANPEDKGDYNNISIDISQYDVITIDSYAYSYSTESSYIENMVIS